MASRVNRVDRLNKQFIRDISDLIRGNARFPEDFKLLTVTDAKIAPDMSNARVFVSHLKDDKTAAAIVTLNRNARQLRDAVRSRVNWKRVPNIEFVADTSFKKAFELVNKISMLTERERTNKLDAEQPPES